MEPGKRESFRNSMNIGQLQEQHDALKAQLKAFDKRLYLTSEEQVERKTLQKLKLYIKDQIHAARLTTQQQRKAMD